MKRSFYSFEKDFGSDCKMIYSSKTGGIVLLEGIQKQLYETGHYEHPELSNLVDEGFIVDENKPEIDDIRNWHELYCSEDALMNVTLMSSESCNFGCPYCFQYQLNECNMRPEVYDATYKLIRNYVSRSEADKALRISWFGGEPTLDLQGIKDFMGRIQSLKKDFRFSLSSAMVTNGYILTPTHFEELISLGVDDIQITLDGNKHTHDSLRTLKGGQPTFDVIYKNMLGYRDIKRKFRVAVRGNYLKSTLSSIHQLIDRFCEDFGDDERFVIYFRPVYHYETDRQSIDSLEDDIFTIEDGLEVQRKLALKVYEKLGRELYSNMFQFLPNPMPSWCPSDRKNAYIIGADGSLYMCDTMVSNKHSVGTISPDGEIVYSDRMGNWKDTGVFERSGRCSKCKLLPICMGGCRRLRAQNMRSCYWTEPDIYKGMEKVYSSLIKA